MNTSDMHPFIHPLSAAVDPAWEAKSDWEIYKDIAKSFSQVCVGHLGKETDVVLVPLQHDSPGELSQPFEVLDWRKGECDLIPGKPHRRLPRWNATILPPGNASPLSARCSISLATAEKAFRGIRKAKSISSASLTTSSPMVRPKAGRGSTAPLTPLEVILSLAPETNGQVAVKAWQALGEFTGRDHTHLALNKEDEKIRFRDIQAQPRKIISSPTWSGLESEHVSYNAGYTNVHELIPWRTLSGRQQLYQDHPWMRAFGESP